MRYSGGALDGQTLWTTADTDGVIVRRDISPGATYRLDFTMADADPAGTFPVAVYTGLVD